MTLKELSDRCGLSISYLSLLERGQSNPTISNLHKICNALNITMANLLIGINTNEDLVVKEEDRKIIFESHSGVTYQSLTNGKPLSAISVDKEELTLTVGDTETITATVEPEDATNKDVTWASSDTSVATVDANGKVTAVAAGTATIIATSDADDSKFAETVVTVEEEATYSNYELTIDGPASAEPGDVLEFYVTATGDNSGNTSYEAVIYNYTVTGGEGTLEYNDDGTWKELPLTGQFGPSEGFELTPDWSATTALRFTPAAAGTYAVNLTLDVVDGAELASATHSILVEEEVSHPVGGVETRGLGEEYDYNADKTVGDLVGDDFAVDSVCEFAN